MQFRKYRKTALIEARQLSHQDFLQTEGIIQTLEGPASFTAGDYLARDRKGQWPIRRAKMESSYQQMSSPDCSGWARYQSLEIREACQMPQPFTAAGLRGKAGDFLVRSGGHEWPVDQELFRATYILIQ